MLICLLLHTVKKSPCCRQIAIFLVCLFDSLLIWRSLPQAQREESQQRCRALENAVTHSETEKRDLLERLSKLVQAVEERDAKLKEQVTWQAV